MRACCYLALFFFLSAMSLTATSEYSSTGVLDLPTGTIIFINNQVQGDVSLVLDHHHGGIHVAVIMVPCKSGIPACMHHAGASSSTGVSNRAVNGHDGRFAGPPGGWCLPFLHGFLS